MSGSTAPPTPPSTTLRASEICKDKRPLPCPKGFAKASSAGYTADILSRLTPAVDGCPASDESEFPKRG
eukprot:664848-Alexandrium_andersonii.AAC.1